MSRRGMDSHFYKDGAFAGYTDYRYSGSRPVTLAGSAKKRSRSILKGAARDAVVSKTIEVMRDWRKTPFEHEGAARAGLRAGLVLKGHSWQRSDLQAIEIVEEALRLVGAERPSWEEAQAGHALGCDYCNWCFRPIDEDERSRGRRFCSAECGRVALTYMARKSNAYYGTILRSAQRIVDNEAAPPQICAYCARSFQASQKQECCSLRCKGLLQAGDRVRVDRDCGICGVTFRPTSQDQRTCSKSCAQRMVRRTEAESLAGAQIQCAECSTPFQPKVKHARFCTKVCADTDWQRRTNERRRAERRPVAVNCAWCGDEYLPKIRLAAGKPGFCGTNCDSDFRRSERGERFRKLTRRAFDHFIVVPIDLAHRRRLTPQKLDWLALELGCTVTGEAHMPAPAGIMKTLFG